MLPVTDLVAPFLSNYLTQVLQLPSFVLPLVMFASIIAVSVLAARLAFPTKVKPFKMKLDSIEVQLETPENLSYQELQDMDDILDGYHDELWNEESDYAYNGRKDTIEEKYYEYAKFFRTLKKIEHLKSIVKNQMEAKNKS